MHAAARNLDSELLGVVPPDQPAATPTIRRRVSQRADYFPPHAEWDEFSGACIENDALQGWRRNIQEWRNAAAAKVNAHSEPQSLSG